MHQKHDKDRLGASLFLYHVHPEKKIAHSFPKWIITAVCQSSIAARRTVWFGDRGALFWLLAFNTAIIKLISLKSFAPNFLWISDEHFSSLFQENIPF